MYGGVSLAIYINGVAQELLRMVKSTAPALRRMTTSRALSRQIRQTLRNRSGLSQVELPDGRSQPSRATFEQPGRRHERRRQLATDADIHVRFMVDVLAGTSAGGINSIYLAKALANDQNIDELKNLWITEGDIHVLINDRKSLKNTSSIGKSRHILC